MVRGAINSDDFGTKWPYKAPKKRQKVSPKQNTAFFLYSSTMTMAYS